MLQQAELQELVAPEQYGSMRGGHHHAICQTLNKCLTFDIIHQWRILAAMCSNDMKSHYGRIVHPVTSLCLEQLRVPTHEIACAFTSPQLFQYHIRQHMEIWRSTLVVRSIWW